jgi:hypothetical protein
MGYVVTKACKNVPKILSALDYLYGEEGRMLKSGLTKETGSTENPIYKMAGLEDGFFWFDSTGKFVYNPKFSQAGGTLPDNPFMGLRLPGVVFRKHERTVLTEEVVLSDSVWEPYPNAKLKAFPRNAIWPSIAESEAMANNTVRISDVNNASFAKMVMGTMPLTDASWKALKAQMDAAGLQENIKILQSAYDRYMKR